MPDIAALVTPPLLLDSTGAPANGDIYVRVTSSIAIGAGIVTLTQGHGKVVAGQFKALDGSAFYLPVTPEDVGVEVFVELNEERPQKGRARYQIRRTVSVPNTATVAWDDLIDMIPVEAGGDYVIPPWVASVQSAKTDAEAAAVTAGAAKDAAVAAAASVPSNAQLAATYVAFKNFDGSPVVGKRVIITLSADQTDIQDITVEAL